MSARTCRWCAAWFLLIGGIAGAGLGTTASPLQATLGRAASADLPRASVWHPPLRKVGATRFRRLRMAWQSP